MSFNLTVTELTFSDGTNVRVPATGVIAIVGPNNAGKSSVLRDIRTLLEANIPCRVIREVRFAVSGTKEDLLVWLKNNCTEMVDGTFHRGNRQISSYFLPDVTKFSQDSLARLGSLANILCVVLNAEERLGAAHSTDAHDPIKDPPKGPIQDLVENERIERTLREEAKRTFGAEFIVRRSAGKSIKVYWGEEPERSIDADRVSMRYLSQLGKLPLLDDQGDGVRSFLGTLFCLTLATEFVVMIDEPEAFLHPPQAQRLGTLVAQLAQGRQVFVATHSSDFLRGLMAGPTDKLAIIHLRREGSTNKPWTLQSTALADTLADPMLRYSNILDGLFHERVVLCESEVDCRFYQAAFDHLWNSGASQSAGEPSIQFTDVGGKSGFARAVTAIVAFGIPVRLVADFDLLNDEVLLSKLCTALGGTWENHAKDWKIVYDAVIQKGGSPPRVEELRTQFNKLCGTDSNRRLDQDLSKRLAEIMKYPGPWADAKRSGKSFIPSGDANAALERLFEGLRRIGIHVVPCGEVECWIREVGGKSMSWLTSVFANIRDGSQPFSNELLDFVGCLVGISRNEDGGFKVNSEKPIQNASQEVQSNASGMANMPGTSGQRDHDFAKSLGDKTTIYILVALAILFAVLAFIRTL